MKKNNILKFCTYLMFVVTLSITTLFLISLVVFIVEEPYIFPIIFSSVFIFLLILYCLYYFNCIKYFKNKNNLKESIIKRIKTQSQIAIVIHGFFSFTFIIILFFTTLYFQHFFKEQLFFLIPLVITISYTLNHIFIEKNIK